MNLQAQRDISRKLKVFEHAAGSGNVLLPTGISEFKERRTTSGSGPLQHMGKRGLSTASPARRISSYALRSPLRKRFFTCGALIILAK